MVVVVVCPTPHTELLVVFAVDAHVVEGAVVVAAALLLDHPVFFFKVFWIDRGFLDERFSVVVVEGSTQKREKIPIGHSTLKKKLKNKTIWCSECFQSIIFAFSILSLTLTSSSTILK